MATIRLQDEISALVQGRNGIRDRGGSPDWGKFWVAARLMGDGASVLTGDRKEDAEGESREANEALLRASLDERDFAAGANEALQAITVLGEDPREIASAALAGAPAPETGEIGPMSRKTLPELLAESRQLRAQKSEEAVRLLDAGQNRREGEILKAIAAFDEEAAVEHLFDWTVLGRGEEVFEQIPDRTTDLLARMGGPVGIAVRRAVMNDERERIVEKRLAAIESFVRARDASVVDDLVRLMRESGSNDVRAAAAAALGRMNVTAAEPDLMDVVTERRTPDPVRREAAWSLATMRAGEDALRIALEDRDPAVRAWAVWGLGMLAVDDLGEILTTAQEDRASEVRVRAALAIQYLVELEVADRLVPLFREDRDPNVKRAIEIGVEKAAFRAGYMPETVGRPAQIIEGLSVTEPFMIVFDASGSVNPTNPTQNQEVTQPLLRWLDSALLSAAGAGVEAEVQIANSRATPREREAQGLGVPRVRRRQVRGTVIETVEASDKVRRFLSSNLGVGRADMWTATAEAIANPRIGNVVLLTDGNPTDGGFVTQEGWKEAIRRLTGAGRILRVWIVVPPTDRLAREEAINGTLATENFGGVFFLQ